MPNLNAPVPGGQPGAATNVHPEVFPQFMRRPPPPRILAIPVELTERPQWVTWKYGVRDSKWTKLPYQSKYRRRMAKTNDPSTWGTFDEACTAYETGRFDGIGYVFSPDDPYFGVDFDNCLEDRTDITDGKISDWAIPLIAKIEGTYGDVSPSNKGVKFIARGKLPGKSGTRRGGMGADGKGALELYDHERFFTITGNAWDDSVIADRQQAAEELYRMAKERPAKPTRPKGTKGGTDKAKPAFILTATDAPACEAPSNGVHDDREVLRAASYSDGFNDLYRGAMNGYPSASEADLALMNRLAYYCGAGGEDQVKRLFLGSKLGGRDKAGREDYLDRTAAKAYENRTEYFEWDRPSSNGNGNGSSTSGEDTRPVIRITTEEMEVNDRAIDALKADTSIFQRNLRLVSIARDSKPNGKDGIKRAEGTPVIRSIQPARLREMLTRVIRWEKFDKRSNAWEPGHPPAWTVGAIAAREEWPAIRYLAGIIETPTLRPDGSVVDRPGYDERTGLLYSPNGDFPAIPDNPTREDAGKAADKLFGLVVDFPFKAGHRAAWLTALLTPMARSLIDEPVPLFSFEANVSGAGKTKLCDIISMIVAGRIMTRTGYYHDPIEMDKQLVATALGGDRMVLFDNLENGGKFGNSSLDRALTGTTYRGRVLGKSEMTPDLDLTCVFFVTGNNYTLCGDVQRRIIPCRLESPLERPEERDGFKIPDLLKHVSDNRGDLVVAALTILRAFILAGKPDQALKAMDYPAWSGLIRNAVVWATGEDPAVGRKDLEESNPDRTNEESLAYWWREVQEAHAPGGMTSATFVRTLDKAGLDHYVELRDTLAEMWPRTRPGELPTSGSIGMKIQGIRGKCLKGLHFKKVTEVQRAAVWKVVTTAELGESSESSESTSNPRAETVRSADTDGKDSVCHFVGEGPKQTHQTHQTHCDSAGQPANSPWTKGASGGGAPQETLVASGGIDFRINDPDAF